jgi:hypothetical protein
MADNVPNELLLETLKAMQAELTAVADDVVDVKTDMRSLKGHMAAFMQPEVAQDGALASIQARIDRVERRLELADG